jgi:hypothetical protein
MRASRSPSSSQELIERITCSRAGIPLGNKAWSSESRLMLEPSSLRDVVERVARVLVAAVLADAAPPRRGRPVGVAGVAPLRRRATLRDCDRFDVPATP